MTTLHVTIITHTVVTIVTAATTEGTGYNNHPGPREHGSLLFAFSSTFVAGSRETATPLANQLPPLCHRSHFGKEPRWRREAADCAEGPDIQATHTSTVLK